MALRFLADHCVPNSIIETVRQANHEVLPLRDVLPVESADAIVIAKAQEIEFARAPWKFQRRGAAGPLGFLTYCVTKQKIQTEPLPGGERIPRAFLEAYALNRI